MNRRAFVAANWRSPQILGPPRICIDLAQGPETSRFVAANWRLPLMFAALAKVPLQASGSYALCTRHAQGGYP
jgi:hypothetical protein